MAIDVVQGEESTLGIGNSGNGATRYLTQTGVLNEGPDTAPLNNDVFLLRPGYSGIGYLDFGSAPGDSATFTLTAPEARAYDLHVRYSSNGDRPLNLTLNGGAAALTAFTSTDPDGAGPQRGSTTGRSSPSRSIWSRARTR